MKSIGSSEKAGFDRIESFPPKENRKIFSELCRFQELNNMILMKLSSVLWITPNMKNINQTTVKVLSVQRQELMAGL